MARGRDGVLGDGAVLDVPREVAVSVEGPGAQAGGEVQGQGPAGRHVGHAGVGHHGPVAVRVAAAPGFPLEVQSQCPATPRLLDLCLDLERGSADEDSTTASTLPYTTATVNQNLALMFNSFQLTLR